MKREGKRRWQKGDTGVGAEEVELVQGVKFATPFDQALYNLMFNYTKVPGLMAEVLFNKAAYETHLSYT